MGFISAPSPLELMVILVVALIVLGPSKLPEAAWKAVMIFPGSQSGPGPTGMTRTYGSSIGC